MNVIVDSFYILVFLEYVTFCDKVCFVKLYVCFYDYEMIMFLNVRILNLGGYNYV